MGKNSSFISVFYYLLLMQVIEQAIPAGRFQGVVPRLETGLVECEYTCSYPSEPRDE